MTDNTVPPSGSVPPTTDQPGRRRLERPIEGRMIAGVCAGVADYLGVDVTLIRVVTAALAIFGGSGVVLYLIGLLLMPEQGGGPSLGEQLSRRRRPTPPS